MRISVVLYFPFILSCVINVVSCPVSDVFLFCKSYIPCEHVCAVFVHVVTPTVPSDVLCFYVCCSTVSFHAPLIQYSGRRQKGHSKVFEFVICE